MPLITSNAYGKISVTDEVVASIAGRLAMECYGVTQLVPRKLTDTLADIFKHTSEGRGVRIVSKGDRVYIDLYVIFKMGTSLNAVADSLKSSIKYGVENFTGMIVETVNVHIMGVSL